jgi:hypothetical protein
VVDNRGSPEGSEEKLIQGKRGKSRRYNVEKTILSFPLVGNLSDDFVITDRTQEGFSVRVDSDWTSVRLSSRRRPE